MLEVDIVDTGKSKNKKYNEMQPLDSTKEKLHFLMLLKVVLKVILKWYSRCPPKMSLKPSPPSLPLSPRPRGSSLS